MTVWLVRIWTHKNADEKAHTLSRRSKNVKKRTKTYEKRILCKFTSKMWTKKCILFMEQQKRKKTDQKKYCVNSPLFFKGLLKSKPISFLLSCSKIIFYGLLRKWHPSNMSKNYLKCLLISKTNWHHSLCCSKN